MIVGRRRQIVKFTVCMIYVIGILVIAKRIMRVSDSFAFDSKINDVDAAPSAEVITEKYGRDERKIFNKEERAE